MTRGHALPLISVITVVRNNLAGLKVTAESVAMQSYDRVEHFIVDGGSTDGTIDWLTRSPLGHNMPWISEADQGIYDAMNKGMLNASGDLVMFLNGGDALADASVLDLVGRDWATSRWPWAYGTLRYITEKRLPLREYKLDPFSRKRVSRGQAFVPHPTTFVETDIIRNLGGFRLDFGFSADQDFIVRVSSEHEPRVFDYVMTEYLIVGAHGASSFAQTAGRYRKIRRANDLEVWNSTTVDGLYTRSQAWKWNARAGLSRLRKRKGQ